MNLFSEIEGLKGENLVTAILRVLLLRSEDIRGRFIGLISNECRLGPLTAGSHFSCLREEATYEQGANESGRLDLILETADAVIGIENKLDGVFQKGQPHKYLSTLEKHAAALAELRRRKFQHILVILAPSSRSAEIERLTDGDRHYVFLAWEHVRDKVLSSVKDDVDPATRTILISFGEFLSDQISFLPRFKEWVPHLKRRFDLRGTQQQREVVQALWRFFPDPGPRMGSGDQYVGYNFCYNLRDHRAWFGFVEKSAIKDPRKNEAELIVVTTFPVVFSTPVFSPITLKREQFLGKDFKLSAWAIEFDHAWTDPQKWRDELAPLYQAVEQINPAVEESPD